MLLQEKLNAHKIKSAGNRPPEIRAILERGTAELRASGILERVLKVGAHAPQFTLPDQNGVMASSANLRRRGPLVLSFYRGHW